MKKKIIFPLIAVLAALLVCVIVFTNSKGQAFAGKVSLAVNCEKVLSSPASKDSDITALLPDDGIIINVENYDFYEGETVFDVLCRAAKENKIAINYTGGENSAYVKSISGLSDGDFGSMSGWVYTVNGEFASVGCSQCPVSDGDKIEFNYSVNMTEDFGF